MFAITNTKLHLKMFKRFLEILRKCHKNTEQDKKVKENIDCSSEIADNLANEALLSEVVLGEQQVCYLRTEAGEFFWNYHEEDATADADLINF